MHTAFLDVLRLEAGDGSESLVDALATRFVKTRATRNEAFYRQGDPVDGLYVVGHGAVVLEWKNANGTPIAFRLAVAGDSFGVRSLCAQEPRSTTARAAGETLALFLPAAALEEALAGDPRLWRPMARLVARDHGPRLAKLLHNARIPATARLAYLLDHLCSRSPAGTRVREVHLPLHQRDLAFLLNVAAETLSRAAHALEEQGVIAHENDARGIVVRDRQALVAQFEDYL